MNNVITILIDSLFAECISNKQTKLSSTPYIDSIAKNSLVADNIYSYGPYTDAATIGLYNGVPTLTNYGYFFGINSSPYCHFRVFKENGYETIGIFYPYYLISSNIRKHLDHIIYTSGFKYKSVWDGKFKYYSEKRSNNQLTAEDYRILEKCMEMVFDCWGGFYDGIKTNEESRRYVKEMDSVENVDGGKRLKEEITRFVQDKKSYIDSVLDLGMDHPLSKVNDFEYGDKFKKNLKKIYSKHKSFFFKLAVANIFYNLKNNRFSWKKIFKSVFTAITKGDRKGLRYIGNIGMLFFYSSFMKKRSLKISDWQEMASLNKQIEILLETLDKRTVKSKDFYASLHILEPHHNISFFSFDNFDDDVINEEIDYIKPLIKGAGKRFSGNLSYQLSLSYVDLCIKRLVESLKERGLLDTTTIMLVADHGSSYFFNPARTTVTNNFHKENYNIPLLIYSTALQECAKKKFSGYYMSEDIIPTLLSVVGLNPPEQMKGKVIYKNADGRKYVITEYMGPGVPDMLDREVWIAARNQKFVIAYQCKLTDKLDIHKPVTVYDLSSDPFEKNNVAAKGIDLSDSVTKEMLSALEKRFYRINEDAFDYIANLDSLSFQYR